MNKSKSDELADKYVDSLENEYVESYPWASMKGSYKSGYSAGFAEAQEQAKVLVEALESANKILQSGSPFYDYHDLVKNAIEQYRKAME